MKINSWVWSWRGFFFDILGLNFSLVIVQGFNLERMNLNNFWVILNVIRFIWFCFSLFNRNRAILQSINLISCCIKIVGSFCRFFNFNRCVNSHLFIIYRIIWILRTYWSFETIAFVHQWFENVAHLTNYLLHDLHLLSYFTHFFSILLHGMFIVAYSQIKLLNFWKRMQNYVII